MYTDVHLHEHPTDGLHLAIGRWSDLAPSLASGESVQRYDLLRRLIWPLPLTHQYRGVHQKGCLCPRSPQDLHPMVFVGTIGRCPEKLTSFLGGRGVSSALTEG